MFLLLQLQEGELVQGWEEGELVQGWEEGEDILALVEREGVVGEEVEVVEEVEVE